MGADYCIKPQDLRLWKSPLQSVTLQKQNKKQKQKENNNNDDNDNTIGAYPGGGGGLIPPIFDQGGWPM